MSELLYSASTSSSSSHSSNWPIMKKLKFFIRFKKPRKELAQFPSNKNQNLINMESETKETEETGENEMQGRSEIKEVGVVLQKAVKELLFGRWEERERAAAEIKRLAAEGGGGKMMKKTLAELGVIPPLVEMVGSAVVSRRRLAVQALLQLSDGTFTYVSPLHFAIFYMYVCPK